LDSEELEAKLGQIFQHHAFSWQYAPGITRLKEFRPKLGQPRDPRLLKLLARYHYYLAWFYNTQGYSRSAIENANWAFAAAVDLYRNSKGIEPFQIIVDAGILTSNSYLASSQPLAARYALSLVKEAGQRGAFLNHHYWRQLALADLQQGNYREALKNLETAKQTILRYESNPADALLVSDIYSNFLKPNWDDRQNGALEVLATVTTSYPSMPISVEVSLARKWVIACGMSSDDPKIQKEATELLENKSPSTLPFGHHATFAILAPIAQAVPIRLRQDFLRLALHQNAFRNS
jgi:tetratricopeptide (TPR) repeat protein